MTRPLIVTLNSTANGVVEFVDDWFHPEHPADEELLEWQRRQMAAETGLILGRRTYEDFRGYWPDRTDDDTGSTDHLNAVSKYVITSTPDTLDWQNSHPVSGPDLVARVRTLTSSGSGELGITGSIRVVHALLAADLVDTLRLFVYPVITGRGRNLAPDGLSLRRFTLTESRDFADGVLYRTYTRR